VNLSHVWEQEFELSDFRALMGVPDGKMAGFFTLNAYCLKPAQLEVNALADHGVSLEPLKRGKTVYGVKMKWWKKPATNVRPLTGSFYDQRSGGSQRHSVGC
jgi:hypothetical protein